MPSVFSWATVKIASLTSLLVTGWYSMSSGYGVRLVGGSLGRVAGSGNRWLHSTWHFSSWVIAGGESSPMCMGGDAVVHFGLVQVVHFSLVQSLIFHTFCALASDAILW